VTIVETLGWPWLTSYGDLGSDLGSDLGFGRSCNYGCPLAVILYQTVDVYMNDCIIECLFLCVLL
jgi:hypothetical protein